MLDTSTPMEPANPEASPSIADSLAAALESAMAQGEPPQNDPASDFVDTGTPDTEDVGAPTDEDIGGETDLPPEGESDESGTEAGAEAPLHWPPDLREEYNSWPVDVRERYMERHRAMEGRMTQATQEAAQYRKAYEPIEEMFAPYKQRMQVNGVTVPDVVGRYIAVERWLNESPQDALQHLAQQYGVDLSAGSDGLDDFAGDNNQIAALKQTVARLESQLQQYTSSSQRNDVMQVDHQINAFKDARADDGTAKYPYFDEVRSEMAKAVGMGYAATLEEAYTLAVKNNPEISGRIQKAEALRAQRVETEAKRKKAAEARRAGMRVSGSGGSAILSQPKTIGEELRAQMKRAGAG